MKEVFAGDNNKWDILGVESDDTQVTFRTSDVVDFQVDKGPEKMDNLIAHLQTVRAKVWG